VKFTILVPSVFIVRFPSKDTENYTLEYSFQYMQSSLPGQSQKMKYSRPELNDNWTKVSYKRGKATQWDPPTKRFYFEPPSSLRPFSVPFRGHHDRTFQSSQSARSIGPFPASWQVIKDGLLGQLKTTPCGGGLEYFHRSPCES
jgi:hypothetical protein